MQHDSRLGATMPAPATAGAAVAGSGANWHGAKRQIADGPWVRAGRGQTTGVSVYFSGDEAFHVRISPPGGAEFALWTSAEGVEAIVASCSAALVRARIQTEAAA